MRHALGELLTLLAGLAIWVGWIALIVALLVRM